MYRFWRVSPDLVVAGKNLLHLIRGELVPLDMDDVVIVPLKAENNHNAIVSGCIYETLHGCRRANSASIQVQPGRPLPRGW
jgi:hypothetical protein